GLKRALKFRHVNLEIDVGFALRSNEDAAGGECTLGLLEYALAYHHMTFQRELVHVLGARECNDEYIVAGRTGDFRGSFLVLDLTIFLFFCIRLALEAGVT